MAGGESGRLRFATELDVPGDGRFRFVLEVEGGSASLTVGGDEVTNDEWVELKRGTVALDVDYARDGWSATRLRLLWEMEVPRPGSPRERHP